VRTNPEDRQTHASILTWIFHAAWCWAENFIPFFVSKRYPGGGTGVQKAGEGQESENNGTCQDLSLDMLPEIVGSEPVGSPPSECPAVSLKLLVNQVQTKLEAGRN
jgi:hypothetical protein